MPGQEEHILRANFAFYTAFRNADLAAMEAVWARRWPVTCLHPGWQALIGRDEVFKSWRAIFGGGNSPPVEVSDATLQQIDNAAIVLCTERIYKTELAATNLFALEDGDWKMVHHQAGLVTIEEARSVVTLPVGLN